MTTEETSTTPTNDETPNGLEPTTSETLTTTQPSETPGSTTETSVEETKQELERLKAALARANKEAKTHRVKAEELDKLKAEADAAKLSETEKLQKKLEALQAAHDTAIREKQELAMTTGIRLAALQMGIDTKAAMKLLDQDQIERDEQGNPTNVEPLLKALVKEYPFLQSKAASASGGATNPSRSQSSAPPELSWEVITELQKDPKRYAERNADGSITRWLYQHPHYYGTK